jgi:putative NADH-flavin reductase
MRVLVLGATGGIGMEIVKQAVARGHEVTALARSPERLRPFESSIRTIRGDPLNQSTLEGALEGQEAVLSGFGPRVPIAKNEHTLLTRFGSALVAAMRRAEVSRLIVVSTAFLFRGTVFPPTHLVGRLFFPTVVTDATAMEETIEQSGLDWTIVRPPRLTDKPHTRRYRVEEGRLPRFGFGISRADVADYMISAMEEHRSSQAIVGVCR